jgi:hypothetical protein
MVRTFLKVYMELGSYFLFLQEQINDHHWQSMILKVTGHGAAVPGGFGFDHLFLFLFRHLTLFKSSRLGADRRRTVSPAEAAELLLAARAPQKNQSGAPRERQMILLLLFLQKQSLASLHVRQKQWRCCCSSVATSATSGHEAHQKSGCCMSRCCEIRLRTACLMCTCFITPNQCP